MLQRRKVAVLQCREVAVLCGDGDGNVELQRCKLTGKLRRGDL
jgi:hypothetical protein